MECLWCREAGRSRSRDHLGRLKNGTSARFDMTLKRQLFICHYTLHCRSFRSHSILWRLGIMTLAYVRFWAAFFRHLVLMHFDTLLTRGLVNTRNEQRMLYTHDTVHHTMRLTHQHDTLLASMGMGTGTALHSKGHLASATTTFSGSISIYQHYFQNTFHLLFVTLYALFVSLTYPALSHSHGQELALNMYLVIQFVTPMSTNLVFSPESRNSLRHHQVV